MPTNKFKSLKDEVFEANLLLNDLGLVFHTFGNVSGIDRSEGVMAIKPSGVPYKDLRPEMMVLVDLDQQVIDSDLRPSSDTKTHLCLYRAWQEIGGVSHTHSRYATAWAQSRRSIPCLGTTHADYIHGEIPCSRVMTKEQAERDYELETGEQILSALEGRKPREVPMVLVAGHGPFTWGKDAQESVHHSAVLEQMAELAFLTRSLAEGEPVTLEDHIQRKHYERKHGANAYYGQKTT